MTNPHGIVPRSWTRGLLPIPLTSVALMVLLCGVHAISQSFDLLFAESNAIVSQLNEAVGKKDLQEARRLATELETCNRSIHSRMVLLYGLGCAIFTGMLVIFWAVWQLTTFPGSRWETWARYATLVIPVVIVAKLARTSPDLADFAQKLASVTMAIGVEHAYIKICTSTGNFDIGNRIGKIYQLLCGVVLLLVIFGLLLSMNQQMPLFKTLLVPAAYLSSAALLLALAWQLWNLRQRIKLQEDPWHNNQQD